MSGRANFNLRLFVKLKLTSFHSMPILGDVEPSASNSHVDGDNVMYSFLLQNTLHKLADNDRTSQRNDTVTKRFFIELDEDDTQRFQDMNFTLISTLQATTATSSDNIAVPAEHHMDVKFEKDIGNATLAVSKVRFFT